MVIMDVLIILAKKGAHRHQVRISTTQIGIETRMSQQNASRILIGLEKTEKIRRGAGGIQITEKGIEELEQLYGMLKTALDGKTTTNEPDTRVMKLTGTVVSGMGEGAYYIRQYSGRIKKALGFVPFSGTLNIRLAGKPPMERRKLIESAPITIEGFETEGRKFGRIFAYPCTIGNEKCFVVVPERTHHCEEVLEIVSGKELRRKFPKGKKVTLSVTIG